MALALLMRLCHCRRLPLRRRRLRSYRLLLLRLLVLLLQTQLLLMLLLLMLLSLQRRRLTTAVKGPRCGQRRTPRAGHAELLGARRRPVHGGGATPHIDADVHARVTVANRRARSAHPRRAAPAGWRRVGHPMGGVLRHLRLRLRLLPVMLLLCLLLLLLLLLQVLLLLGLHVRDTLAPTGKRPRRRHGADAVVRARHAAALGR